MGRNPRLKSLTVSNVHPEIVDLLRYASLAWRIPQSRIVEEALRSWFTTHPVPAVIPAPPTPPAPAPDPAPSADGPSPTPTPSAAPPAAGS